MLTVLLKGLIQECCIRKLGRFGVKTEISKLFYQSTIIGVWRYCLICWGGNLKKTDVERLNDIIKRAERVVGVGLAPVDSVYQELLGRKLCQVCNSPCTPKALSPGVERQILGVKISARVIQLWHAHCKRLDAAFKIHNALV